MPSGACVIRYDGKRGVAWRIKYLDSAGKQVQETVGTERDGVTRKQAEIELRERLTRVDKKGYRRPKRVTFGDYARTWFEEARRRRDWKPKTVRAYRNALDRLDPSFGRLPLASIRPRDIAVHVKEALGTYAPATVNLDVTVLGDVLKAAKRDELIDSNPADGVERPKIVRHRWRILEPVEVRRVYAAFADEQARAIFLTLTLTGLRRFELQALRWRDVDLVESVLRVRVSKSEEGERTIALVPALAEALWQQRRRTVFEGDGELVFCHPRLGSKIGPEWYAGEFRAALKVAGIDDYVRPFHDARHGALTNMAATGPSPIALMATAGHRSMQTTNQYLHLAGVVFRDEAQALADRYKVVPISDDLSESESTENGSTVPVRVSPD
jgi:integrase